MTITTSRADDPAAPPTTTTGASPTSVASLFDDGLSGLDDEAAMWDFVVPAPRSLTQNASAAAQQPKKRFDRFVVLEVQALAPGAKVEKVAVSCVPSRVPLDILNT